MEPIYEQRLLTSIVEKPRDSFPYGPYAASLACPRCGSKIDGHARDGIVEFTFESTSLNLNWLRFKHVVVLTLDGKLSISCESLQSVGIAKSVIE